MPLLSVATMGVDRIVPVFPFVCEALAEPPPLWLPAARSEGSVCLVMGTTCTHLNTIPVVPPTRAMRSNGLPVVLEIDGPLPPLVGLTTPCLTPPHPAVLTINPLNEACRSQPA